MNNYCKSGQKIPHWEHEWQARYAQLAHTRSERGGEEEMKLWGDMRRAYQGNRESHRDWNKKELVQNPIPGMHRAFPFYIAKEEQPLYCTIHLPLYTNDCTQYSHLNQYHHLNLKQQRTTNMASIWINKVAAAPSGTRNLEASLTTTTAHTSINCTTMMSSTMA